LQQEQQQQQEQEQKHGSWAGDFLASAHRRHLLTHADIAAAASGGAGAGLFSWSGLSHGQQQQQGGAEERADMSGTWASHSLQGLTPQYVVSEKDGRPPARPLLCSPGLVCTGDVEPMPNTCVKVSCCAATGPVVRVFNHLGMPSAHLCMSMFTRQPIVLVAVLCAC
jgi:hypothetical protein